MIIIIDIAGAALRRDHSDDLVLFPEGQIEERKGRLPRQGGGQAFAILFAFGAAVVDDDLPVMVETAHREMRFIRQRNRERRQGPVVLDGSGEFEHALAGIVQSDGENGGIHQGVDILVDGMDDILDRQ